MVRSEGRPGEFYAVQSLASGRESGAEDKPLAFIWRDRPSDSLGKTVADLWGLEFGRF
jgi:hypothetical protein